MRGDHRAHGRTAVASISTSQSGCASPTTTTAVDAGYGSWKYRRRTFRTVGRCSRVVRYTTIRATSESVPGGLNERLDVLENLDRLALDVSPPDCVPI
jgi:hypothetical protein